MLLRCCYMFSVLFPDFNFHPLLGTLVHLSFVIGSSCAWIHGWKPFLSKDTVRLRVNLTALKPVPPPELCCDEEGEWFEDPESDRDIGISGGVPSMSSCQNMFLVIMTLNLFNKCNYQPGRCEHKHSTQINNLWKCSHLRLNLFYPFNSQKWWKCNFSLY